MAEGAIGSGEESDLTREGSRRYFGEEAESWMHDGRGLGDGEILP